MAYRQIRPRRTRPPARGGFSRVVPNPGAGYAQVPTDPAAGWEQQVGSTLPSPTPPYRQLPATSGVSAELDPATGQPYAHAETMGDYTAPGARPQPAQPALQARRAALAYVNQQLGAYSRVADLVGSQDLNLLLAARGAHGANPLEIYTRASALFTALARKAGYADPRVYLRDLLQRAHHGRATAAA